MFKCPLMHFFLDGLAYFGSVLKKFLKSTFEKRWNAFKNFLMEFKKCKLCLKYQKTFYLETSVAILIKLFTDVSYKFS